MKRVNQLLGAILIAVMFIGCAGEQNQYKMGYVRGTVMNADGNRAIGSAKVQIDVNGDVFLTTTDHEGKFTLSAPVGTHDLVIYTGKGHIFRTVISVNIEEGKTTDIPPSAAKLNQVANLAYIPGAYDRIESIIIDSLGYTATQLSVSDLDNLAYLQTFNAIFLNCGKYDVLDSAKYANLAAYAYAGGSLYASDWAVEYLTGDGNFRPAGGIGTTRSHTATENPDKSCTDRLGGFISTNDLCTEKIGSSGLVSGVSIVDQNIQNLLNATQMDIDYNLGAWEVIQVINNWQILLQDNTHGYGPLAARYLYFNPANYIQNGNWVTICHIPPGNPNNPQTITISINALQAHLNHGDFIGPCQQDGNILYTTFHNHHQGNISHDVYSILEYFILSL